MEEQRTRKSSDPAAARPPPGPGRRAPWAPAPPRPPPASSPGSTPPPGRPAAWMTPCTAPKRSRARLTAAAHAPAVGDVGGGDHHTSAPSASSRCTLRIRRLVAIVLAVSGEPRRSSPPLRQRRRGRPAPGGRAPPCGELLGHRQPQAAEAAGDQVDAALAQTAAAAAAPRRRGSQALAPSGSSRARPTIGVARRRPGLGDQQAGQALQPRGVAGRGSSTSRRRRRGPGTRAG